MAQVKKQGSPKKKSVAGKNKSIPVKKPVGPKQSKGLFGLSRAQTVLLIWVLIICSLLICGYKFIVVPEQQKNDRITAEQQRFAEGQKLIDDLAAKAALQFPPTEKNAENSCSYVSMKFANGPLSCSIEQNLIYRDISVDEANRIMAKLSKNKPLTNSFDQKIGPGAFSGKEGSLDRFYVNLTAYEKFCSNSFAYPSPYYTTGSDVEKGMKDLTVSFWCSQSASKEFYPTTNKNY